MTSRRWAFVRAGFVLAVLTALTALAVRAGAQPAGNFESRGFPAGSLASVAPASSERLVDPLSVTFAPVPFAVGEELVYRATFGGIPAGKARMRVEGIEVVRGRAAYKVVFRIDGGVPFFRVRDRYESWIDVETLASLRHRQSIAEGGYKRNTSYEIFPDRAEYRKNDEPAQPSVRRPLDDGSFIYAVRADGVRVGETRRDDRYFRPDRNPVVLAGVRNETVKVNAGTFSTVVVRPSIRANGLFAENGDAQIWFTDDEARLPVQVKTKFSKFTLTLTLESATRGDASTHRALLLAATESD